MGAHSSTTHQLNDYSSAQVAFIERPEILCFRNLVCVSRSVDKCLDLLVGLIDNQLIILVIRVAYTRDRTQACSADSNPRTYFVRNKVLRRITF